MIERRKNIVTRAARAVWRGFEITGRVLLVLFCLAVLVGLLMLARDRGPEVPESAALVIAPRGVLVEQLAGNPTDRAIQKLTGQEEPETLWRDLADAIHHATTDDRIKALYIDPSELTYGGLTKLQALRAEIDAFRAAGKTVVAFSDFYMRDPYYLASAADEIFLHPHGLVFIDGYGRYRTYYKQGIDRAEIDWNVFRVGEYKSAVEPFLREDMSPEAREANLEWMGDLWRAYLADVATARGLQPADMGAEVELFVERVKATRGDTAEAALASGLVDTLADRDGVRARMIELVGEDEEHHTFHQIGHASYLEAIGDERRRHPVKGDGVAVVIAKGTIMNGNQPPGSIGGDSTARLIRDARQDDKVKAIVLRVDSGGGSALASEIIRRELVLAREAGKKVVVSMGTVAASGGYWISSASDQIWASPTTITGSIGIFGMIPTFQKPMEEHLGWKVDGVGTTWLAGAVRPDRELDPRMGELIQVAIEDGYRDFLDRVGEARSMTAEEVDQIARGRVWSGEDAHALGLVDELGDLDQAIGAAAELAELEEGYAVRYVEKKRSFGQKLADELLTRAGAWLGPETFTSRGPVPPAVGALASLFEREIELLASLDDPYGVYALCFCEVE